MKIAISPVKNSAIGWDITVSVTAEDSQKIANVTTTILGFDEPTDVLQVPVDSYERTYIQKGVFPGHNDVLVRAIDTDGKQSAAVKKWDS
jgi:ssRNA-specific RNase YbeY (16S rRNA maturation enzyme)